MHTIRTPSAVARASQQPYPIIGTSIASVYDIDPSDITRSSLRPRFDDRQASFKDLCMAQEMSFPMQQTEEELREQLTVYEAYEIIPSRMVEGRITSAGRSETIPKWTEAMVKQQFSDVKDIIMAVRKLDSQKSFTKKMRELGPNQLDRKASCRERVSRLV